MDDLIEGGLRGGTDFLPRGRPPEPNIPVVRDHPQAPRVPMDEPHVEPPKTGGWKNKAKVAAGGVVATGATVAAIAGPTLLQAGKTAATVAIVEDILNNPKKLAMVGGLIVFYFVLTRR
jgi:hypothetical protein